MFASKSASASLNSANAGSRVSRGDERVEDVGFWEVDERNELRDEGRRGVVGREGGFVRDREGGRDVDILTIVKEWRGGGC